MKFWIKNKIVLLKRFLKRQQCKYGFSKLTSKRKETMEYLEIDPASGNGVVI